MQETEATQHRQCCEGLPRTLVSTSSLAIISQKGASQLESNPSFRNLFEPYRDIARLTSRKSVLWMTGPSKRAKNASRRLDDNLDIIIFTTLIFLASAIIFNRELGSWK
jgi:hypothetical protein